MQTVRVRTSQNIDIDYEVAGLGERILAYLIDLLIFGLVFFLTTLSGLISRVSMRYVLTSTIIFFGFLLLYALYDLICEAFFNGQSIGKRVMKIRVISIDGSRPSLSQFLLRWIFRIVDITLTSGIAGIISIAVSERNQRIGDIVAGTTLVRTNPRTDINQLAFIPPLADYKVVFPEAAELRDKDISLLHEVLANFRNSENHTLLHNAAVKIKNHLTITDTQKLSDEQFLQTIIRDYNHIQTFTGQDAR